MWTFQPNLHDKSKALAEQLLSAEQLHHALQQRPIEASRLGDVVDTLHQRRGKKLIPLWVLIVEGLVLGRLVVPNILRGQIIQLEKGNRLVIIFTLCNELLPRHHKGGPSFT